MEANEAEEGEEECVENKDMKGEKCNGNKKKNRKRIQRRCKGKMRAKENKIKEKNSTK